LKKIEQRLIVYTWLASGTAILLGRLRFDISGSDAVISYLVSPKFQGKGLGTDSTS
jgi:RimJ/RimL family protein N-acetyltransferase